VGNGIPEVQWLKPSVPGAAASQVVPASDAAYDLLVDSAPSQPSCMEVSTIAL
jgi:hypothetical protein